MCIPILGLTSAYSALCVIIVTYCWQACVRDRAAKSLLCVREMTEEEAFQVVDQVFPSCFRDTDPFERVPP